VCWLAGLPVASQACQGPSLVYWLFTLVAPSIFRSVSVCFFVLSAVSCARSALWHSATHRCARDKMSGGSGRTGGAHCTGHQDGFRTHAGCAVWCAGGAGRVVRVLARCGGGAEAADGHRVRGVRLGIALIGLFCGESGVSEGIRRAGLAATGVDMSDMPRYRQRFGTAYRGSACKDRARRQQGTVHGLLRGCSACEEEYSYTGCGCC
jgi:hypothetical protein